MNFPITVRYTSFLKLKHKVKEVSVPAAYDKMIWSEAKCDDFVRALNSAECTSKLDDMVLFIEEATGSEASVGLAVDLCVEALRDAADPIFKKKMSPGKKKINNSKPTWATDEWVNKKKEFFRSRDKYVRYQSDSNRKYMTETRAAYKKTSWRCRRDFQNRQTGILLEARLKNVKQYWKLLSNSRADNNNVTNNEFYEYFKCLSNPSDNFYSADEDIIDDLNTMLQDELMVVFEELNRGIDNTELLEAIKELDGCF